MLREEPGGDHAPRCSGGDVVGQHGVVVNPLKDLGGEADVTAASPGPGVLGLRTDHLTGGDGSVPLHHLLWLQDHLLVDQLSGTLHQGLRNHSKDGRRALGTEGLKETPAGFVLRLTTENRARRLVGSVWGFSVPIT